MSTNLFRTYEDEDLVYDQIKEVTDQELGCQNEFTEDSHVYGGSGDLDCLEIKDELFDMITNFEIDLDINPDPTWKYNL